MSKTGKLPNGDDGIELPQEIIESLARFITPIVRGYYKQHPEELDLEGEEKQGSNTVEG